MAVEIGGDPGHCASVLMMKDLAGIRPSEGELGEGLGRSLLVKTFNVQIQWTIDYTHPLMFVHPHFRAHRHPSSRLLASSTRPASPRCLGRSRNSPAN